MSTSTEGTIALVRHLPPCDVCNDGTPAAYDAKTKYGPWANLCRPHWREHSNGHLGAGNGQLLVVEETPHADYPHERGRLPGCPACEERCHCIPGTAECVWPGHEERG